MNAAPELLLASNHEQPYAPPARPRPSKPREPLIWGFVLTAGVALCLRRSVSCGLEAQNERFWGGIAVGLDSAGLVRQIPDTRSPVTASAAGQSSGSIGQAIPDLSNSRHPRVHNATPICQRYIQRFPNDRNLTYLPASQYRVPFRSPVLTSAPRPTSSPKSLRAVAGLAPVIRMYLTALLPPQNPTGPASNIRSRALV